MSYNIDRAPGIAFIEAQMLDICLVERDAQREQDDVLNEDTFELEAPDSDTVEIYAGKCIIVLVLTKDREIKVASMPSFANVYEMLLPVNTTTGSIKIGDIVTVTSAYSDDSLLDKVFRVTEINFTTHRVYRRLQIEQISDAHGSVMVG